MALSEKQRKANDKYIKENYQRLPVSYPKEFCETVRNEAKRHGLSLAGFVKAAIEEKIHRGYTVLDGETPPAIQAYLDEVFEQRKAIVDATSYCGNTTKNPVWKGRTENKKAGE
jgi:hypothetical protein